MLRRHLFLSVSLLALAPGSLAFAQQPLPTIDVGGARQPVGGARSAAGAGQSANGARAGAAARGVGVGSSGGTPVLTPQNSYVVPNASTGTKTNTPIMDTPINVQVITEKALQDQQAITVTEALRNVSGVSFGSGGAASSGARTGYIYIRGFATPDIYRNGVRLSSGAIAFDGISARQIVNVQSIEVLKGPAAILYGRSEPGGIINLTTKDPQETPHYAVGQQVGSLALYRTTFSATGPVTKDKSVLYRFDGSYENNGAPYGSFVDGVHSENFFVAPVVKWNIDNDTSIKAELEYNNDRTGGKTFLTPRLNGSFINTPRNVNYGQPGSTYQPSVFAAVTLAHQFNSNWSFKENIAFNHVDYSYTNGTGPLLVLPGADAKLLYGGTQVHGPTSTISSNTDIVGHVETFGAKHTLLIGGDYYHTSSSANGSFFLPWAWSTGYLGLPFFPGFPTNSISLLVPPIPFPITFPVGTLFPLVSTAAANRQDTAGAYVQDQVELPYGIHILVGARYQNIYQASSAAVTQKSLLAGPLTPDGADLDASRVTPRFGLLWRPQQWVSVYGNYTEGFAPNRGLVYPGTLAPPSSAVSWEAGAKFEFFDGRLRATADYYNLVKTNVPITDPNTLHRCGGGGCILLTGEARSQGPELDIQGELLPGWNIIANYTNQDVRVTKGTSIGNGQSGVGPGQRFPNVPRNLASLWSTYEFQDATFKGLKFGAGYTYHGSQTIYNAAGGNPNIIPLLASWGTVDLMSAYSFTYQGVKTTAQLNVSNLFDRTYYTDASVTTAATAGFQTNAYRQYGAPFSVMGQLRMEF